jgi:Fe2+ or Zn2+ uptake regulation protein
MAPLPASDGTVGDEARGQGAPTRPDVHDVVAARLQAVGQRYTGNRGRLVALLAGAGRPLSLPEILAAEPGMSQSSAYRNLALLEQVGAVGRILTSESAHYELAEGLREHHHHLVCLSCGSLADVTLPARSERAIDAATQVVAGVTGFQPTGHRLDIIGICDQCAVG